LTDCIDLARLERKGGKEELRVSARSYKSALYAELRVWFRDGEGVWHPTSKGVTVRMSEACDAARALEKAPFCIGPNGRLEAV
jgi:hypothetical protein